MIPKSNKEVSTLAQLERLTGRQLSELSELTKAFDFTRSRPAGRLD